MPEERQDAFDPTAEEGLQAQEAEAGERPAEETAGEAEEKPDFKAMTEEIRALKEKHETALADNKKLMQFHDETAPLIPQLKRLKDVFGDEGKAPAEKAGRPEIPPNIMRDLQSADPKVRQDAVDDYMAFHGDAAAERAFAKREQDDQERGNQARDKYSTQQASKQRLALVPQFKELMAWANPIMTKIESECQYNEKMQADWAWLDYVPNELYGMQFLLSLVGAQIVRNPEKFKDGLALITAVDEATRKGMSREAATGGVAGGKAAAGEEGDVYSDVADDLLAGSDLPKVI